MLTKQQREILIKQWNMMTDDERRETFLALNDELGTRAEIVEDMDEKINSLRVRLDFKKGVGR